MSPTYVFVHGSYSNSFSWAPTMRAMAMRGHRTLAVDLPGHGFGATPEHATSALNALGDSLVGNQPR